MAYWEPTYDPISILEGFCIEALGTREEPVDHYIQQWIKEVFGLRFAADRQLLQTICRQINHLFFGAQYPSRDDVHASRATTASFDTIMDVLRRVFSTGNERSPSTVTTLALGAYTLLRFNRSLRTRYAVLASRPKPDVQPDIKAAIAANVLGNEARPRLCLVGARPLEFTHLQVRAFGGLTGVQGLNYVFRGGLLPRMDRGHCLVVRGAPGTGKTAFSTHLLADMASRGRFTAYLSLEEGLDAIVERLETFGLYDPRLYGLLVYPKLKGQLRALHDAGKGAFALIAIPRGKELQLSDVLSELSDDLDQLRRFRWRTIAIDSIDSLRFNYYEAQGEGSVSGAAARGQLRSLFQALELGKFFGLLVAEAGGSCERYASFLADTDIEIGKDIDPGGRWVRILKSRLQPAHEGTHVLNIKEGQGLRIFPSLTAIQGSIRRRVKATLSEERVIPIKMSAAATGSPVSVLATPIREKSCTLIHGPSNSGKTELMLHLATAPSEPRRTGGKRRNAPPRGVLIFTFRTSEFRFRQRVLDDKRFAEAWKRIPVVFVRWYSPGDLLQGEHIVDDLRERLRRGRRQGIRIERVIFEEIDAIEQCLPGVASERMFWPTVIDLLSTEAITATFVLGTDGVESPTLRVLKTLCDYVVCNQDGVWAIEKAAGMIETSPNR
jgi:KaiC/GvpD/RAD55 family RecA-like ATPase